MKDDSMTFQQRSIFQQGYQRYSPDELRQLEWGLRFTPLVCSLIAAYGLFTQQPNVLFAVSVLGIWAFLFPAVHPMDLLYNHVIRIPFNAVKLPENPFQRRLACLSAGIMNFIAAVLFIFEYPTAALVVGCTLLVLQAIVITTHFCTLSWMYEGAMRLLGKWELPIRPDSIRSLLNEGARLVDVRTQQEFARGSIEGALNYPLEELEIHQDQFKDGKYLLFCASGTRSHIATEKLTCAGVRDVYNAGDMSRLSSLVT
jgi:rhodanese-related sulfurtransferase